MSVRVVVDNRVRIAEEALAEGTLRALREAFSHRNPDVRLKSRGRSNGEAAWVRTWGTEWVGGHAIATFPRGGLPRVRQVLRASGLDFTMVDDRVSNPCADIPNHVLPNGWKLRGYQEAMNDAAIGRENCLLRAPTGSGKTTAALALVARLKQASLIVVWEGSLFEQWQQRVRAELQGYEPGVWAGGKRNIKPITIAMQQTIATQGVGELTDYFGLVLADEVQRFAAPTLFASLDPWRAKYRIGISADESRKDKKEFLTYDLFGSVAYEVKQDTLIASGDVLDVEIRVVPTDFRADWYRTTMIRGNEWQKRAAFSKLAGEIAADQERNTLLLSVIKAELESGESVLTTLQGVAHCEAVDAAVSSWGIRSGTILGGTENRVQRRETIAGLVGGTYRHGVGTRVPTTQGLDLPAVGRIVVGFPLAANRQQFGQVRGRACRPAEGKADAALYYLWDRHVFGKKHLQNLMSWYKNVVVRVGNKWVPAKEFATEQEQPKDEFGFMR